MREFLQQKKRECGMIAGLRDHVVGKLDAIWARMGFEEPEIMDRLSQAESYVNDLYGRMINEENELLENHLAVIETRTKEIDELSLELGRGPFRYTGPETLLHKKSRLEEIHQELKKSKDEKMVELFNLKQIESELTSKLSQRPALVPVDKIPSPSDLDTIRESIKRLKMLRDERWMEFSTMREECSQNLNIMGERPKTTFEEQVINHNDDSYFACDPDNLVDLRQFRDRLSQQKSKREQYKNDLEEKIQAVGRRLQKTDQFISKLISTELTNEWIETLENNLNLLEEEKKTKLKGIILNMREELRNVWDKLHFSQEQRDKFEPCYVEQYTETICTAHENEIKKLNDYYDQNVKIFAGFEKWEKMFEQYCEFRDREKDPNRYKNNRGNKLAKQLAEFNALKKKMPRFEDLLIGDVATWQSEHDKFFEINGIPLQDYIEEQWATIANTDKAIREDRHRRKKEGLAVDMVYGTRTPTKRGNAWGSARDLTKRSKLESTAMSSVSRFTSKLNIPAFRGTPTKPKKENAPPPQSTPQQRKLRRRSRSAANIMDPTRTVASRIKTTIGQFRTPQPVQRSKSKMPVPKTEKPVRRKMLAPVEENVQQKLLTSFDDFDIEFAPTSIKSAPNNFCDEQPESYEDFGRKLRKENRSSAIGCIQLSAYGAYDM